MANIHDDIRTHVDAFVSELSTLVHQAALEAVRAALGDAKAPVAKASRAPKARAAAKPAPAAKSAAKRPAAPAKPAAARGRKKGQKRDPRDLAALVERLAGYINANPGQRIEQINNALGVPTKDLTLPIKKLLAGKRISSKGEKRATTYSPR